MKPSLEREFFSMFISFSLLCCAEDYKPVLTDESSFGKHPNINTNVAYSSNYRTESPAIKISHDPSEIFLTPNLVTVVQMLLKLGV